jgi:type I restriction enzyme S subunit
MAAVEQARAAAEAQSKAAKSLYTSYLRSVFDSDAAQQWKKIRLGDVSIVGPDNGVFKKRDEFGRGVPIVNVLDLFRSLKLDLNKVERVNASQIEQKRYAIAPGDLFFCRSSLKREGVGWCCYVEEVNEPAVFECHVMRVRLDTDKALPNFVAHYWRHPAVRDAVISSAKTATMTTMNQADLARIAIPLPTINEQHQLAATLSEKLKEALHIESAIQNQLSEINKLPAALLRQAFIGKL